MLSSLILFFFLLWQGSVAEEQEFRYYGQLLQDGLLHIALFQRFQNGFFVEVGAADGIVYSNTLFFEKNFGWSGINIEPNRRSFDKLIVNRPNSINLNVAIDKENGEEGFLECTGHTSMLSGMVKHFHPTHIQRLYSESLEHGEQPLIVKVPTRSLQSIFDEYKVKRVHLLTIDIEGGEFAAIQSIDFSRVYIDVIMFEGQFEEQKTQIVDYLMKNHGYFFLSLDQFYENRPKETIDVIMGHRDSPFLGNSRSVIVG